ncbi:hypothetical protein RUM44_009902 [Polyplax serrata]|uniref:Uncharacterized protein n=1 Tax=Polyplax serrata TaxID=468196 RepID=A0ABR1AU31_POLSC
MEVDLTEDEVDLEKIERFVTAIGNRSWMSTAVPSDIDDLLGFSAVIQDGFSNEERTNFKRNLLNRYPGIDISRALDSFLVSCISSSNLNENLTLRAIEKYMDISPTNDVNKILEDVMTEIKLRENVIVLSEKLAAAGMLKFDWQKVNLLLNELNSSNDEEYKMKMAHLLKSECLLLLNAVKKSHEPTAYLLLNKIIHFLESQSDLKFWFILMKPENVNVVVDLSVKYGNFLNLILKFFDKFADETETNFDEDLNSKYSHLNLDFDEFITVFKLFLNEKNTSSIIHEYLDNKILMEENNYLFWVDVKACI